MEKYFCHSALILVVIVVSGCSQSGQKRFAHNSSEVTTTHSYNKSPAKISYGKTVVLMTKVNGVYEIPTEVNGVKMHFIFDTGAGMISMSNVEAGFLYKQGKLTEEDIVGNADFIDANGDVSEGLVVRLREVKVGERILTNVEASIVPNLKAPLLFGQSALEQFGKVSIDYKNSQITFE